MVIGRLLVSRNLDSIPRILDSIKEVQVKELSTVFVGRILKPKSEIFWGMIKVIVRNVLHRASEVDPLGAPVFFLVRKGQI